MIIYTTLILIVGLVLFVNFSPAFGGSSAGKSLEKIQNSKNYDGKKFVNLVPTGMMNHSGDKENNDSIFKFFFPSKDKNPQKPLPTKKFNKSDFKEGSFVWFGHSTILMKTNNVTIITDPVFNRGSPVIGTVKPFKYENDYRIEDLPKIDVVVISHDHYDHLDYKAIKDLKDNVSKFLVPLGVKAHLLRWGVDEDKIEEIDWYENVSYKGINFTLTPTRHFSGRGLTNRFSTLWGAWIVKSKEMNIYSGGDSGYFDEFKKIGEIYGPFDIVFMENGAYNKAWADIHMMPEESIQAAQDLRGKIAMPIHWAKFDLSYHNWDEPIQRFTAEAKKKNINITTPMIGEVFDLKTVYSDKWWE